jgi:hypothetical protein
VTTEQQIAHAAQEIMVSQNYAAVVEILKRHFLNEPTQEDVDQSTKDLFTIKSENYGMHSPEGVICFHEGYISGITGMWHCDTCGYQHIPQSGKVIDENKNP